MAEENFEEEEISEHVAIIKFPSMACSRRCSHTFGDSESGSIASTPRTLKQNTPPCNSTLDRLLYQPDPKAEEHFNELRKRHMNLAQNLEKQRQIKEKKLEHIQKDLENKRMADCTFKPKLHSKMESTRTLEEFLESQQRFAQKVMEKKKHLKEMLNDNKKDETFRPKLMKQNNGSIDKKIKEPVHERLYNLRNKQSQTFYPNAQHEFKPNITEKSKKIVREGRVDLHLYNDALRRQEKFKGVPPSSAPVTERPPVNLVNEKYVAQKFIKEYYLALEEMEIQDSAEPLQYIVFNQLLYRLGFVISSKQVENKTSTAERGLVYEAFRLLEKYTVNIRNICVFLLALIGIYHINPTNFESKSDEKSEFNLTEGEGRKLQKHFDLLYRNRLSAEQLKKTGGAEEYSFKPVINPDSAGLAENYRNRMLEQTTFYIENNQLAVDLPEDGLISHADLLILNRMGKQKENQKRKELFEEEELRECTFKPALIGGNINRSMISSNYDDDYPRKHEELYNLSKVPRKQEKNGPSKAQVQSQLDQKQCTFAPKINKKKLAQKSSETVSKDVEKSVFRMIEGRKQRENKNKFLERGYHNTSKAGKDCKQYFPKDQPADNISHNSSCHIHNSSSNQNKNQPRDSLEQETPFLVIDVNLGEQVEQIVVYKGEVDQPELLADQFAARHGLDDFSKSKLLELLKIEISNILQKIEEEEENSSDR